MKRVRVSDSLSLHRALGAWQCVSKHSEATRCTYSCRLEQVMLHLNLLTTSFLLYSRSIAAGISIL